MQTQTSDTLPLDDLYTINDLAAKYPNILTEYTLRWQLRDRAKNGLGPACVRVGKNILISKSRYEQWLATRTN